ncbi:MAG: hypothetical protein A3A96_01785 [Candidatus Zambryskibacteria bacterium RIFCSPLOWO2_01_FULL_39_39]|uniref:Mur ligase central domain-containing protein n=1 Tax=Candidatus Zambryskibacteria bacterium RIFCSPLOWO2_01_FULL_39_39 TaxID=1802758 RepID=A0A1G2TVQ2_9BACT|nr:MAG: hypothetical protein A3B88_03815 [Candidatus Zambryskibacteria bacterium RIFCSPHIGHO2_02_FULL_39_19]OHB01405.1 MAG: hypothetical protein A3A96_01785 [Candidatus Zambryskibacteria bacterium RIFCSPLOWO2_01_FULL_39_39]
MKKFLSKYSLKYPRSLVYMLQASEYNIVEFLDWFRRVKDFAKVEERKTLVKTIKASLLYAIAWNLFILSFAIAIASLWFFEGVRSLLVFLVIFLFAPYLTLYLLSLCTFLLNSVQRPIERIIINKAKEKLQNHKALKIGIAGSFGKTTMKEIIKTVLEGSKNVAATPDNKNTPLGIARFVESLDGDEEILIFEMGEYYEGDIKKLCEIISPDIGVITGVNEAHLDKFKNIERTAKTIFELADFLSKKEGTKVYVNKESRSASESAAHIKNENKPFPKVIYYGHGGIEEGGGNWKVEGAETNLSGTSFILKNNKEEGVVVRSKLLGLHQIGPLAVASHIAQSLGIKLEKIELGLKNTKPFKHRMEPREDAGGVLVIDDSYNGNPDGVKVAIEFLKEIKDKRRFFITPGLVEMGRKTEEVHREIGKELANTGIEKVVLIRNSVTPFIEAGLKENNFKGEVIWFESSLECFSSLPKRTINNDLLLYQNDWPDNYS